MEYVRLCCVCAVVAAAARGGGAVPVRGQVTFPEDGRRQDKKIHEEITPPVLPVIAHLENDPSTLLPNESGPHTRSARPAPNPPRSEASPRFGFNQGFDVSPNSDGGVTASFSNGYSGFGGNSQAAAHSLSFGFNKGFQASHSSSLASSFSNSGFGSSSFSGSQASSQSSSFSAGANGLSASAAAASAAASSMNGISSAHGQSAGFGTSVGGNSAAGSQSASSAFGSGNSFANSIGSAISGNNFGSQPSGNANFGEGVLDIRHRARGDGYRGVATSIVFPGETSQRGRFREDRPRTTVSFGDNRWRGGVGSTTYRDSDGDWLAILVSD